MRYLHYTKIILSTISNLLGTFTSLIFIYIKIAQKTWRTLYVLMEGLSGTSKQNSLT